MRCTECLFCIRYKSDINGEEFYACGITYKRFLNMNNQARWQVWKKQPEVFEGLVNVDPSTEHKCVDEVTGVSLAFVYAEMLWGIGRDILEKAK